MVVVVVVVAAAVGGAEPPPPPPLLLGLVCSLCKFMIVGVDVDIAGGEVGVAAVVGMAAVLTLSYRSPMRLVSCSKVGLL